MATATAMAMVMAMVTAMATAAAEQTSLTVPYQQRPNLKIRKRQDGLP